MYRKKNAILEDISHYYAATIQTSYVKNPTLLSFFCKNVALSTVANFDSAVRSILSHKRQHCTIDTGQYF